MHISWDILYVLNCEPKNWHRGRHLIQHPTKLNLMCDTNTINFYNIILTIIVPIINWIIIQQWKVTRMIFRTISQSRYAQWNFTLDPTCILPPPSPSPQLLPKTVVAEISHPVAKKINCDVETEILVYKCVFFYSSTIQLTKFNPRV